MDQWLFPDSRSSPFVASTNDLLSERKETLDQPRICASLTVSSKAWARRSIRRNCTNKKFILVGSSYPLVASPSFPLGQANPKIPWLIGEPRALEVPASLRSRNSPHRHRRRLRGAGGDEIFGRGPKMLAGGGSGSRGGGSNSHLSSPHRDLPGGRGGRSFLFGNTWFMLSAYPARLLHTADRRAPAAAASFVAAAIHRTPRVVRASGGTGQSLLQRGIIMAACGYAFGRAELGAAKRQLEKDSSVGNHTSRIVAMGSAGSAAARPDVSFRYRGVEYCKKVGVSLKCREQWGSGRTFWTNAVGPGRRLSFPVEPWARDFSTSCVAPYSAGATERQLTLDEALQDKQMDNSTVASDEKSPAPQKLKLLSGSCYLPHPAKEATGGEDGHFICIDEQAIGVADGVGGWADHGVDAGLYAKELMSKSMGAIKDEPEGAIDPSRVLEKAFTSTKARGSSTACIITLKEQGLHAVNLGDSGFIVVRDGHTVLESPSQQHDFNFTYQLESGGGSDLPSSADVFHYPVAHGDVIVAGTDGLFDNLYTNEIIAVIVEAVRGGLAAQATAQKIAALARVRALDKHRQSPFAAAAQEAGYRFYGGKLDDITVVVSYVTSAMSA